MFRQLALFGIGLLPLSLAQISDGFEDGWNQSEWPTYAPQCASQGGVVSLDTTVAHSGHNSMKVVPGEGYCGHIFFGTTAIPEGDFYVRTWLKMTTPLDSDHVSFIIFPDANEASGDALRFGAMDEVMIYNREDDDATLPDLSPDGIATSADLPANSWQCLEFYFGTDGTVQTWLNSDEVAGLSVGPGISNANSNGWKSYTPKLTGVYFGWESYSGTENTFWYDDVAVASTRVGCAVSGVASSPSSASSAAAPPASTMVTSATAVSATSAASAPTSTCTVQKYGQCGGQTWGGCTTCAAGSTCQASGSYYSQCL